MLASAFEPYKRGVVKIRLRCPSKDHGKQDKHCVALLNPDRSLVVTCFADECKESAEIKELNWRLVVRRLFRAWIYIIGIKRFIDTTKISKQWDKEQFNDEFASEPKIKGKAHAAALGSPTFRKYDLPIYLPGNHNIIIPHEGRSCYNLWRPQTDIQPCEEGDISRILEHARYMWPKEGEADPFFDFLAFLVQKPGEKVQWLPLLIGKAGIGKSYWGDLMRTLLGNHNVFTAHPDQLKEKFNGWLGQCQLLLVEEFMALGRREIMNKLKPWITQPTVVIRDLNKPAYIQPNKFNVMAFSNHLDSALLEGDDRRYYILESKAERQSDDYYDKVLWPSTRQNYGTFLNWLLQRDLSNFRPQGKAPMTDAKREVIALSMPRLEAYMINRIEAQEWPFDVDLINVRDIRPHLEKEFREFSDFKIAAALKAVGAHDLGQVPLKDGSRPRIWAVRQHGIYANTRPSILAEKYLSDLKDSKEPIDETWLRKPM